MHNLEFHLQIGKLKSLPRRGWVLRDIPNPETVACHMYRAEYVAYDLAKKLGEDPVYSAHLMRIHDMPEAKAGDITPHDGVSREEKARLELEAARYLAELSGNPEYLDLFLEYEAKDTIAARIGNDADQLECVIQAMEYGLLYPAKRPLLEEFWPYARKKILTDLGHDMLTLCEQEKQRRYALSGVKPPAPK